MSDDKNEDTIKMLATLLANAKTEHLRAVNILVQVEISRREAHDAEGVGDGRDALLFAEDMAQDEEGDTHA